MSNFFKNPVVHAACVFLITAIAWFLTTNSPILTMTIGGVGAGIVAWLTQILS